MADDPQRTADNYRDMFNLVLQAWYKPGEGGFGPQTGVNNLAKPQTRQEQATITMQIRDKDAEAIEFLEKVLERY